MRRKVIIDTDPGVDDMVAILAALHCVELELLGVTTVGGNVPLETTARNALRILARVGRLDVPVYAGLTGAHTAEHVHGDDGLAGCPWPDAAVGAQAEPAVEFLVRRLAEGDVTLACLGPLTNLAAALRLDPGLGARVRRVVLMGGGFGTHSFRADGGEVHSRGNVTETAEFNIYSDVAAAQAVFASGVPVTVVPLDVSQQTLVSAERLAALEPDVAGILDRYGAFSRGRWGHHSGPLHDPNVLARIAEPELYAGLCGVVRVSGEGQTVLAPGEGPHEVMLTVEAEGYLDWVWRHLDAAASSAAKRWQ